MDFVAHLLLQFFYYTIPTYLLLPFVMYNFAHIEKSSLAIIVRSDT